ncbi:enolase-phosphatase E1 [Microtetraspora sp. NBRC 13810]|uniref:acireductone synthase n=1 Tax=Microtetraspora sp. NBRC 13810 TaxID=3030990 RepID=UPI0024A4CF14|nr:acireductone synthase [Microtetraspora sp. NBRC 13810]GLW10977.1 enolase-phosphatase E1 [Microtetraspora sp. NBRC 13810]
MTSPSWVVLDIEGTTSSTESVHVGLYSYARPRLGPWIDAHPDDPDVREAVRQTGGATTAETVAILHGWMDGDVKATPLKTLQGQIWAAGFAAGELTAHFFPDVAPVLRAWHAQGRRLAVFSSGSVASQRPWFRHSTAGDLSVLVEHHFDTVNAGPKREPASYLRIAETLGPPAGLLFLSDVPAELDAAAAAGWRTTGVRRPGEPSADADFGAHPVIASFEEIK